MIFTPLLRRVDSHSEGRPTKPVLVVKSTWTLCFMLNGSLTVCSTVGFFFFPNPKNALIPPLDPFFVSFSFGGPARSLFTGMTFLCGAAACCFFCIICRCAICCSGVMCARSACVGTAGVWWITCGVWHVAVVAVAVTAMGVTLTAAGAGAETGGAGAGMVGAGGA